MKCCDVTLLNLHLKPSKIVIFEGFFEHCRLLSWVYYHSRLIFWINKNYINLITATIHLINHYTQYSKHNDIPIQEPYAFSQAYVITECNCTCFFMYDLYVANASMN